MINVINFYKIVEDAYEKPNGVMRDTLLKKCQKFIKINPSKMEQKQLERKFYSVSGYNIFKTWQKARKTNLKMIKM